MTAERLSMRKLRELFRLRFEAKLSTRAIAASLNMGNGTVCDSLGRARAAKLPWPLPPELDDDEVLAARLFPTEGKAVAERLEPDWAVIHAELKKKGVTKLLLWQEYLETHPDGYRYSRFCERYEQWLSRVNVTMRQEHRAGEKAFVDFSGDGVEVVDGVTGEVRTAPVLPRLALPGRVFDVSETFDAPLCDASRFMLSCQEGESWRRLSTRSGSWMRPLAPW